MRPTWLREAEFRLGDLQATGLDDASVDAIMCIDTIQFADSTVGALVECRRILRPGGRVVLTWWEPRTRGDPSFPPSLRDLDVETALRQADFNDVCVVERSDWQAAERAMWTAAADIEPDEHDEALRDLQDEAQRVSRLLTPPDDSPDRPPPHRPTSAQSTTGSTDTRRTPRQLHPPHHRRVYASATRPTCSSGAAARSSPAAFGARIRDGAPIASELTVTGAEPAGRPAGMCAPSGATESGKRRRLICAHDSATSILGSVLDEPRIGSFDETQGQGPGSNLGLWSAANRAPYWSPGPGLRSSCPSGLKPGLWFGFPAPTNGASRLDPTLTQVPSGRKKWAALCALARPGATQTTASALIATARFVRLLIELFSFAVMLLSRVPSSLKLLVRRRQIDDADGPGLFDPAAGKRDWNMTTTQRHDSPRRPAPDNENPGRP